ncbi:MAG: hypothetical protein E7268_09185 [Lachnospiraceae bacterium]|nr:hypothetical protein [Lachnospiraceae bacterium]
MRKVFVTVVTIVCLSGLMACSGGKDKLGTGQNSDGTQVVGNGLLSEDYRQGNASAELDGYLMRTEQGYYYYSKSRKGFRYYDITTGKDMFLCNKPECKHDGNAFCVATNENYTVLNYCLYSNRIYVYAMEETDTQYHLKVLSLALDGSELNEVATVLTLEKTGRKLVFDGKNFCIHRDNIMIALDIKGENEYKDKGLCGTAILDLNTGNVIYMDEEVIASDNPETKEVHAYGDYFYYYQRVKKKNVLHRYNIVTGMDETHKFQPGFSGLYVVLGENTIAYLKTNLSAICFYYYDTGETIECTDFTGETFFLDDNGELQPKEINYIPERINGDGTYAYAVDFSEIHTEVGKNGEEKEWRESYVIAYGEDGKKIAAVNIAKGIDEAVPEGVNLFYWVYWMGVRFLGEEIYAEVPEKENRERFHVFKCKRSDFLAGEPKFEHVFVME